MTTSIQDVAQKAGVSISTVSRSFTRPDLVSTKTRERVLAIADELNFFPVPFGSGLEIRPITAHRGTDEWSHSPMVHCFSN